MYTHIQINEEQIHMHEQAKNAHVLIDMDKEQHTYTQIDK